MVLITLKRFLCVPRRLEICNANQLVDLYMMGILIANDLRDQSFRTFVKCFEKLTFLAPDTHTIGGGKKC